MTPTFSNGAHLNPVWSPDSKQVAFTSDQQEAISVKTIGDTAPEQTLLTSPTPNFQGVYDWSQDGRYILYGQGTGVHVQVWVLPTFGDRKPFSYTKAPDSQEWNASFSPDGRRWVAYVSPEAGPA